MKNGLIAFILLIILGTAASFFLPWWVAPLLAFCLFFVFPSHWLTATIFGFSAIALVWTGFAWYIDSANDGILSGRIGELFQGLTTAQLLLSTALIGGLGGALGALSGNFGRQLLRSGDQIS